MNKKTKLILLVPVILAIIAFAAIKMRPKATSDEQAQEITPTIGHIETTVSTTGTVLPKNRLEITPPVNGRVESVLVKEGEMVKDGQVLAWMSSTERAAILDAAEGQGPDKLKYWEQTYKPIPLLAPIDGEIIVATVQPGQTVTTSEAVLVLSDHLIVRAQVDETDIGKVRLNQDAVVSLDAYADNKIKAKVEHIYYESETVNNVTVYKVDLVPEEVPLFFRSGMNATVNFIIDSKDNAILVPLEAVHEDKDGDYVMVKNNAANEPARRTVVLGVSDDKNIEIVSGLGINDKIIMKTEKFVLPKSDTGKNPFMPSRRPSATQRK
ncbi:MAG: HlyD family efflux transporter periplasmic adaptor subunit [Candidatus Omnitrophota bacterium]